MKTDDVFRQLHIRRTAARCQIYELLLAARGPLTVAEIARQKPIGEGNWLSTIYRTVELFVEKGICRRIALPPDDTFAYYIDEYKHRHYAICSVCRKMVDLPLCPVESLEKWLREEGFTVTGHRIELYGLCQECANRERLKQVSHKPPKGLHA